MAFDSKIFWKNTRKANRAITESAQKLRIIAGREFQSKTQGYSDAMLASLRTKTKQRDGEIYVIKLAMLRYGIIREHGAGRGSKSGPTTRKKAPWISTSFNSVAPKLANRLAKIKGDDMVALLDDGLKKGFGASNYRI